MHKFNIKLILANLKSIYEIRKRLLFINQVLIFFFFFKYCSKNQTSLLSYLKFNYLVTLPKLIPLSSSSTQLTSTKTVLNNK